MTRETSQPEMSALKLVFAWKSLFMSVTPETFQQAMGPYVSMAEVGFELYAATAVSSEVLSEKVWPVQGDEGAGELGGGGLGEGGVGDGGKGVGDGGCGGVQQASLHSGESLLFLFRHIFLQIFLCFFVSRHLFLTLLFSRLVHPPRAPSSSPSSSPSSLRSVQSSDGPGAVPRARPPLISGSIFAVASKATSGVVDGATAPTQLSTLSADSRHVKSGMLIICVDHVGFQMIGLGSTVWSGVWVSGLGQARPDALMGCVLGL